MIWSADAQIKIASGGSPQTSHGPAIAASPTRLYIAYIGQDGSNVWWAWTDNQTGNFTDWQGDVQIKLQSSKPLHSSDRPALVFFQGMPVLFTITPDHKDLQCSWFDGNQWSGYSLANVLGKEKGLSVVSAQVFAGQVHLVVVSDQGPYFHCVCAGDVTSAASWSVPGGPGSQVKFAGLFTQPAGLILVTTSTDSTVTAQHYHTANPTQPGSSFLQPLQHGTLEPAAGSPTIAPAPSLVVWNGILNIVYIDASHQTLMWAPTQNFSAGNMLFAPSTPIRTSSTTAKTRTPPAVIVFQNQVCIAHSGQSSSNLFLTYGH